MLDTIKTIKMDNFDEDEELLRAMEESLRHFQEVELPIRQIQEDLQPSSDKTSKRQASPPPPAAQPAKVRQTNLEPSTANVITKAPEQSNTWSIFKPKDAKKQPVASTSKSSDKPQAGTSRDSWCNNPQPSTSKNAGTPKLWQDIGGRTSPIVVDPQPTTSNDSEPLQLLSTEKTLTDEGFCMFTGRHWVYPTNYPERKYQLDMAQTALFHNTLVCLPTGLGKTFIAAVVMYNYYRWFPKGKIIFMAPTKPLVAQQIKACYEVTGIPKDDTEEMTGMVNAERRTASWKQKRVFFATPQVVANDLVAQICPVESVRCLVIDEAHRAQGNYAYCQVINTLRAHSQHFRVLALSATPGSDINNVKKVLENLMISKLKIATEDSPDVAQYTHQRDIEVIKVAPTAELNEARDRFLQLMDKYWQPLTQNNIVSGFNTANITQFQVKTSMDKLLKSPPNWLNPSEVSRLQGYCLICISLCHAQELLQYYGLRSFLSYIQGVLTDSKSNKFVSGYLSKDEDLLRLIEDLNEKLGLKKKNGEPGTSSKIVYGHPKLLKLQEIVVQHFLEYEDRNEKTRAIIFCQYRDSVEEIRNLLQNLEPIVKPMSFVGQAKSKGTGGLTQKQQLQVMRDFRSGDYNTLISTCVGEEGLDIGEVDLIVCVDASKSPIRLVQRMGRTGRKRSGRIVMLLSEGKEYKKYIDSKNQQSRISKAILTSGKLVPILNQVVGPRMVPRGLNPVIYRTLLTIPKEMKNQDIRKMTRKLTNSTPVSSFPTAEELAQWDGEVPEFDQFELQSSFLSFLPIGKVEDILTGEVDDIEEVEEKSRKCGQKLNRWLEWQRNLQGPSEAYHSSDSDILVDLLQLGDRMNLNNPTLLTQTADLVSEVDSHALFGKKGKGKGRGKKGKTSKDTPPGPRRGGIEWCIQQQNNKPKRPHPALAEDDFDVFLIPDVPEPKPGPSSHQVPENVQQALKDLTLLNKPRKLEPKNPFHRVLISLSELSDALPKNNLKPDLSMSPPDIGVLDAIFSDLVINPDLDQGNNKVTSPLRKDKIVPEPPSPILGKRKLVRSQQATTNTSTNLKKDCKIIKTEETPRFSSGIKQPSSPTKITEPRASTSKDMDVSQGMQEFLMNFDIGFDEDILEIDKDSFKKSNSNKSTPAKKTVVSDIKTPEILSSKKIIDQKKSDLRQNIMPEIKSSPKVEVTSSPNVAVKPSSKVEVQSSPKTEVQCQMDFNILDEDDDLFADVDISTWMGEFEKKAVDSVSAASKSPQIIHPPKTVKSDLVAQKSPQTVQSTCSKSDTVTTPKTPQIIRKTLSALSLTRRSKSPLMFSDDLNSSDNSPKVPEKFNSEKVTTPSTKKNIVSPLLSTSSTPSTKSTAGSSISKLQADNNKLLASPLLFSGSSDDWASPTTKKFTEKEPKTSEILSVGKTTSKPNLLKNIEDTKLNTTSIKDESGKNIKTSKLSMKNRVGMKAEEVDTSEVQSPVFKRTTEDKNKSSLSDDDSFVVARKNDVEKSGGKAIIISSDEDEAVGSQEDPINISTSSDEEVVRPIAKKKIGNTRKDLSLSSEDDFIQPGVFQVKRKNIKEHETKKPKKQKKNNRAHEFFDVEAEVSGEFDSADDMETSQMDQYDESFINNYTQADPSVDMRAQYLRSVKSPIHHGKFKIPELTNRQVYKSPGEDPEEDSAYMNDSFCVESEGSGDDSSEEELDELEAKLEANRGNKKKRTRQDLTPDITCRNKGKKLKRIIVHSSSDDDSPSKTMTVKQPTSLEASNPMATSTPHVVKGFEADYIDDDADLDAIMAQISATQEAELMKQADQELKPDKKSSSRSLFGSKHKAEGINATQNKQNDVPEEQHSSSVAQPKNIPGPSWKNSTTTSKPSPSKPQTITSNQNQTSNKVNTFVETSSSSSRTVAPVGSKLSMSKARPTLSDPSLPSSSSAKYIGATSTEVKLQKTAVVPPQDPVNDKPIGLPKPIQPNLNAKPSTSGNKPESKSSSSVPVIIASTKQVTSAPNLLTQLRISHKINVLIKTLPTGVDFVISQRLAVGREQIGNITSCAAQSDLAISMRSIRQNFKFVVLILENSSSRPVPEPRTSWEPQRHLLPGTRQLRLALCHLQRINVKVVFTKDQAETASILHNLAVKENQFKFGIMHSYCKSASDSLFDSRLRFFTTLPGVNIALALKLAHQYPVISDFIKSCTSPTHLEKLLSIDRRHAASIFQVITQFLQ